MLFGLNAYSKTVVLQVPDNAFSPETKITANYDGSISISNPRVYVTGKYLTVEYNEHFYSDRGENSSVGLCALIGKSYVTNKFQYFGYPNPVDDSVALNPDGTIRSLVQRQNTITEIVCR